MTRLVIDTNLYVSAMINQNSRSRLNRILEDDSFQILVDKILLTELYEVIRRPKFSKYLNEAQIETFMTLLNERCSFIFTKSKVQVSPDAKDDFLLSLCLDGNSDFLITGDKRDLLALNSFHNTRILSLTAFINLVFPG